MTTLTPRARVEAALRGEWADYVPFTSYENKFFYSQAERELRNAGMCIMEIRVPAFKQEDPEIVEEELRYTGPDGIRRIKKTIRTSAGVISEVQKQMPEDPRIPRQLLPWHEEYYFKGPADYDPIEAMIRQRRYHPNYAAYAQGMQQAGGDLIFVAGLGYSPLQELLYNIMGIEQFAFEWRDRRQRVLRLYDALTEDRRKIYPLLAGSPTFVVEYCGNVSPEVVGVERFEKYILPHYNELAEVLHPSGKVVGVHFDARMWPLAQAVAGSKLDFIEAFTPLPTGDMSVADARAAWPGKALWINFPSTLHLEPPHVVEQATVEMLRQAAPGDRFLIGITETVPVDRWQANYAAITRAIQSHGRLPLG
jgi:hypothetical protein